MKNTKYKLDLLPIFVVAITFICSASWAQDIPGGPDCNSERGVKGSKGHSGSSQWDPDKASDIVFVVDVGGDLDQLTWRTDGPLEFDIPVTRVVGDKQTLVDNGILGKTAKLFLPAWDVDYDAQVSYEPERDRIFFNDHVVDKEYLQGANQTWEMNSFDIPIEWINFPSDPGDGNTVQPVNNHIRIMVDAANTGERRWVTEIDWAQLNIEMAPPVVLVHGIFSDINSKKDPAWSDWSGWLDDHGILNHKVDLHGLLGLESIDANSQRIKNDIDSLKNRWGVEKVTIVAHSKGGLDARDYAESHDDVDRLFQIATPNAGAIFADQIQAVLLALSHASGVPAFDLVGLAAPAGQELSVTKMAFYNLFHGLNEQNTEYRVLAGDCEYPSGWLKVAAFFSGHYLPFAHGDGIVSVRSAHSVVSPFPFSPFKTTGSDDRAMHTEINKEEEVFGYISESIYKPRDLSNLSHKGSRQIAKRKPTKGGALQVSGCSQGSAVVIVQGDIKNIPITVGQNDALNVLLYYSQGDVDLAMISPSGQRWGASFPVDGVIHEKDEATEGFKFESYGISNAVSGIWTAEVSGVSVSGTQAVFVLSYEAGSSIDLETSVEQQFVVVGDDLVFFATFKDSGNPITGAAVNATVQAPDGTTAEFLLEDNGIGVDQVAGDGVYSVSFTTSVSGEYEVSTVASSTSPLTERMTYMLATASESTTSLSTSHTDLGVDSDGNGLYDLLRVRLELNVDVAANYRILAQLSDSSGMVLDEVSSEMNLATGLQKVDLDFSGVAIYELGADGPYEVSYVALAEAPNASTLLPLLENADVYQTDTYSHNEFEHAPISLAGGGTDQGVDSDLDGVYDLLRTEVDLNIDPGYEGNYEWSATLISTSGVKLGFTSGSGYLASSTKGGTAKVSLDFSGEEIGSAGQNGAYSVENLILWGGVESAWFKEVYETQPYSASQFKGGGGDIVVDVTPDVTTTYDSWVLDTSTGAMVATITIQNNGGKSGIPLEKIFWYAIEEGSDIRLVTVSGTTNGLAYFDVTDQVEALLPGIGNGDMRLDVGESVTYTVSIYTRDRSIPTGHVYAIWADPPIGEEPQHHVLDVNGDNVIDDFEILDAVDEWNGGGMDDFGLLEAIQLWKAGGYSLDDDTGKFVPVE